MIEKNCDSCRFYTQPYPCPPCETCLQYANFKPYAVEDWEFVPVNERLPKNDSTEVWETYLCKLNRFGEELIAPMWFEGGSWYSGYIGGVNYDEFVVAWRNLPKE